MTDIETILAACWTLAEQADGDEGDVLVIVRRLNAVGRYEYQAHHMRVGESQMAEGPAHPARAAIHYATEDVLRFADDSPDTVDW